MIIENHIETQYRNFKDDLNLEYKDLYQQFDNEKLRAILSTIHAQMIGALGAMNERLPTHDNEAHFWAGPSRVLIKAIEGAKSLQKGLQNTKYAFQFDEYYKNIIDKCSGFLEKVYGSTIPPHMDRIQLYYKVPIFIRSNSIVVTNPITSNRYDLTLLGEGSYAYVYKYEDSFYQKCFVLKRAKKNLDSKELDRFAREFHTMQQLVSPYIVEVYNYSKDRNEYVMEYMDYTLDNYINKNNSKLTNQQRINIARQVLKAFSYIHSKNILHRDISPKNILLKEYEDVVVVKISDFGLVKIPESDFTSMNTEFKGYFNDHSLRHEGFNNYGVVHEIYALTHLLFYILTGKTNIDNIKNDRLKEFVAKGMSSDKSKRFLSVEELTRAFNSLFEH